LAHLRQIQSPSFERRLNAYEWLASEYFISNNLLSPSSTHPNHAIATVRVAPREGGRILVFKSDEYGGGWRILTFKSDEYGGSAAVGPLGAPSDSVVHKEIGEVGHDCALRDLPHNPAA
jgi:hypothetical protein